MDILNICDLNVSFVTDQGLVKATNNVNLNVQQDDILGIIGESGSGKSVLALSILRLLQNEAKIKGDIFYKGIKLDSENVIKKLRGKEIGMVMQNPSTSFNPVLSIGYQIAEPLIIHKKIKKNKAFEAAKELLMRVRIKNATQKLDAYPHQFSGGMKERAIIAMGIVNKPGFIIVDEPTKGLDIKIKQNIIALLQEIALKNTMLIITHDFDVVNNVCNKIAVMYAGEILEISSSSSLLKKQYHPYTQGFLNSLPINGLTPIPGSSPSLINLPKGCSFHPRCDKCSSKCKTEHPPLTLVDGRYVRCFLYA